MRNRRRIVWYHPDLKEQATELRNNCTESEKVLWESLKGKQMMGYDFHRQKPLDHFIVDFFCNELMLAIEIDGSVHTSEDSQFKDFKRQEIIEDYGVSFLRFTNNEVMEHLDHVLSVISQWICEFESERDNPI